jgi:hypothetical protein
VGYGWAGQYLFLWASYLSFIKVGSVFMSFQWDRLLIEAGMRKRRSGREGGGDTEKWEEGEVGGETGKWEGRREEGGGSSQFGLLLTVQDF